MNKNIDDLLKFDFHDGRPDHLMWDGENVELKYVNWREINFKFTFKKVAHFSGFGAGSSLCDAEISKDQEKISRHIAPLKEDWYTEGFWHLDKLYMLTLSDGIPFFTIIFEDVKITQLN